MRDDKDRGGKWMLEKHGDSLLRIGGVSGFTSWRAAQSELVAPKRTPDGLLEAFFPGQEGPDPFLIEILTYPDRRNADEVLRDVAQVFLARGIVPDGLTVVLRPRGSFRLSGEWHLPSRHNWTLFEGRWRVVELWTIPAATLLATNDVGLVPWAILAE